MCTVSVIPPAGERGLRIAVNRDERRTRSIAWAPQRVLRHDVAHVWPIDPDAGGTWAAASGSGLLWALLNLNRGGPLMPRAFGLSRGHVIPVLAGAVGLDDAERRFSQLDLGRWAPFRLLVASREARTIFLWDGIRASVDHGPLHGPEILSSSSLGDHLVERPREQLFDELLARYDDSWSAQDHLHQHAWPDRRHLSVMMSRPLARTVSRTVMVVDGDSASMSYAPIIDGWVGPVIATTRIPVTQPVAVPA
jgi:hypothetical protein